MKFLILIIALIPLSSLADDMTYRLEQQQYEQQLQYESFRNNQLQQQQMMQQQLQYQQMQQQIDLQSIRQNGIDPTIINRLNSSSCYGC